MSAPVREISVIVLSLSGAILCAFEPAANGQQPDVFNSQTPPQTTLKGGVQYDEQTPDPNSCFSHAWRAVQNAEQAYQLALNGGLNASFSCQKQAQASFLQPCWTQLQQAKTLIEQAAQLYDRARRTSGTAGAQVNSHARTLNAQSANYLAQADQCYQGANPKGNGPGTDTYNTNPPPNKNLPPVKQIDDKNPPGNPANDPKKAVNGGTNTFQPTACGRWMTQHVGCQDSPGICFTCIWDGGRQGLQTPYSYWEPVLRLPLQPGDRNFIAKEAEACRLRFTPDFVSQGGYLCPSTTPTPGPNKTSNPSNGVESAPIFHYFYINGINTPMSEQLSGHQRTESNDPGGTYLFEYGKVNSTLVHTTDVVPGETDQMGPYTHNTSGKDQALTNFFGICGHQSGQQASQGSFADLVAIACSAQRQWSGGGLAWGDIIECLAQGINGPDNGITFTSNEIEVIQIADLIHQTFLQELQTPAQNRRPHYFIIVAHSQGNFFAEGVAYRLLNQAPLTYGKRGPYIVHNRLGIISLGSPTQYDSLPTDFVTNQIRHITRADDGIHILDVLSGGSSLSKRPWQRSQDVAALWPWRNGQLDRSFSVDGVWQVWQFMQQKLPALATPFMNAHLLDNYLTDPTATPAVLTGSQKKIPQNLANMLRLSAMSASDPQTPIGTPVLSVVQQNVRNLKKFLLALAKVNGANADQEPQSILAPVR